MLYAVHKILKRGKTIKNQPKFDVGTDVTPKNMKDMKQQTRAKICTN